MVSLSSSQHFSSHGDAVQLPSSRNIWFSSHFPRIVHIKAPVSLSLSICVERAERWYIRLLGCARGAWEFYYFLGGSRAFDSFLSCARSIFAFGCLVFPNNFNRASAIGCAHHITISRRFHKGLSANNLSIHRHGRKSYRLSRSEPSHGSLRHRLSLW